MNKSIYILLILLGSVMACTESNREDDERFREQKDVFLIWMESFRYSDVDAFRQYQSIRMRDKYENIGWKESFADYKDKVKGMYGNFKLDDFTLSFFLDETKNSGRLKIEHRAVPVNYLDFVKEDGHWRVDQELVPITK